MARPSGYPDLPTLDLAIWLTDLSRLEHLKRALAKGLALTQDTAYGGVAHHQVDVHLFDSELFASQPKVILFDRAAQFLVALPRIDAGPREIKRTPLRASDDDMPF